MPEPTKAAIAVPSEDPKKKKPEEKAEDVKDGASKKKDEEKEGEEPDGGGALGDAAALVKACLQLEVSARPTFEKILQCRFLVGESGWGLDQSASSDSS